MASRLVGALILSFAAGSLACGPADRRSENKALVRRYMEEVLNRGDVAAVAKVFPDSGFVLNGRLIPPSHIGAMRASLLERFPDFHLVIEEQIAEGDKVVTRVTFRGTHSAEYQGIPATGRRVSYGGVAVDRIRDGKVIEGWHQADDWGLLRQLGAKVTR